MKPPCLRPKHLLTGSSLNEGPFGGSKDGCCTRIGDPKKGPEFRELPERVSGWVGVFGSLQANLVES